MAASPSVRTLGLTLSYVAVAALDTLLAGRATKSARRLRYVTKPALMPLLSAATRDARNEDVFVRRGLRAAQAMSWAGDVALLGRSEPAFLAGLGSFFGAHLAYIATFAARHGRLDRTGTRGLRTAGLLWLTTTPVMTVAARRKDPALAGPVAGYATVLAAMFATSSTIDPSFSATGRRLLQAGTALFLVSDTLLGAREFVLGEDAPGLDTAVMATYTAAQLLIALGATHL